jgi:hypothetical protein
MYSESVVSLESYWIHRTFVAAVEMVVVVCSPADTDHHHHLDGWRRKNTAGS